MVHAVLPSRDRKSACRKFLPNASQAAGSQRRISVSDRARTNLSRHAVMSLRSRTFIIAPPTLLALAEGHVES
jgi:hypothetical protein